MRIAIMLRVDEAAQVLRVSRRTVQRWVQKQRIPALPVGRTWRIPRSVTTTASYEEMVFQARADFDTVLPAEEYLLPAELRRALHLSRQELRELAPPSHQVMQRLRYARAEILEWLMLRITALAGAGQEVGDEE